jgi:hypothetical protein
MNAHRTISTFVACVLIGVAGACGGDDGSDVATSDPEGAPCSVKGSITKGDNVTSLDGATANIESDTMGGHVDPLWNRYFYRTQVWNDSIDRGYKVTVLGFLPGEKLGPDDGQIPNDATVTEFRDRDLYDGGDGVIGEGLRASAGGSWEILGDDGARVTTEVVRRNYAADHATLKVSFRC